MRSVTSTIALFVVLAASPAVLAQPFGRTFVSAQVGSDANLCLPTAPCRTLARALVNTEANGEIIVLDSGGYGTSLTIDKAVQIEAPAGVYAGMTTAAGNSIVVNTSGSVLLQGLTLNSTGGTYGIYAGSVGSLHVDHCKITGFYDGIHIDVGTELFVRRSTFRRNSHGAIYLGPASGTVLASVNRGTFERNEVGLWLNGSVNAIVQGSLAADNSAGFVSQGSVLTIESSIMTHNSYAGAFAEQPGTLLRVSSSTVTNNATGFLNLGAGATFLSRNNNTVEGNTTNTAGTIGSYAPR